MGGKKREKIFFQKYTYIESFKRWKKIVWKKCENTFFYKHMNIVTKNRGKNAGKNYFHIPQLSQANNDRKNRL